MADQSEVRVNPRCCGVWEPRGQPHMVGSRLCARNNSKMRQTEFKAKEFISKTVRQRVGSSTDRAASLVGFTLLLKPFNGRGRHSVRGRNTQDLSGRGAKISQRSLADHLCLCVGFPFP